KRTVYRERRNDGVHARAIGKPGVDHWRGIVDAAANPRDHALDDAQQMTIVFKFDGRSLEFAAPFDIDEPRRSDEDVGNGGVAQQRFEGAETKDFIENFF